MADTPMAITGAGGEVTERFGPCWMAPEQEQALEEFVLAGGAFMPIHNSSEHGMPMLLLLLSCCSGCCFSAAKLTSCAYWRRNAAYAGV
jgi:hypothetical protein